ncbi:MAG: ribokinase [Chloroflexi bacterium]|nr:ribokinase [Chloroflexota bacterium]
MIGGPPAEPPDYLLVGHLCRDWVDGAWRLGGTAAYAGVAASRLGRRVAVVSAGRQDLPLGEMEEVTLLRLEESPWSTAFAHHDTRGGRRTRLLTRAGPLGMGSVPAAWRQASLVHLAPVCDELPPALAAAFPNALVGATAQGWLRAWDRQGWVRPVDWRPPRPLLPSFAVLCCSSEDLGALPAAEEQIDRLRPLPGSRSLLVVTRGSRGATVYGGDETWEQPAVPGRRVDTAGAGDVFAAAFLVRLSEGASPRAATHFASAAASLAVAGRGVSAVPDRMAIERRLQTLHPSPFTLHPGEKGGGG